MAKRQVAAHSGAEHRASVRELLARFPATGRDRAWNAEPVVMRAFGAAHHVFDKHIKGKIKTAETNSGA